MQLESVEWVETWLETDLRAKIASAAITHIQHVLETIEAVQNDITEWLAASLLTPTVVLYDELAFNAKGNQDDVPVAAVRLTALEQRCS